MEVSGLHCSGVFRCSVEVLSSTKFSLNFCSQAGNSCDISLCTSLRVPHFFVFCFCGFMQRASPNLCTRTSTSLWYWIWLYLLTSNTKSCDEDDGEVGEGVVEEELADKLGTINGILLDILQSILLPFLMTCGF